MTTTARLAFAPLLALTLTASALTGCTMQESSYAATEQGLLSENLLSENLLSENLLSENLLSENLLSENGLAGREGGLELLKYIAKCALPVGDSLATEVNGVSYTFPGRLGIAPEWKTNAIGHSKRRAMSACLMAHVNHFGISVPFSYRSVEVVADAAEENLCPVFEGAFFGDVFGANIEKFACSGDALDPETAGWRSVRVCTDVESGTTTYCGFTYVGACSDVCTADANGTYVSCQANGQSYSSPANVWLID